MRRIRKETWVAIGQKRGDGEEDFGDSEGGTPLVLEDVEADVALGVHVAVIDASAELHLRWYLSARNEERLCRFGGGAEKNLWGLEGVIVREGNVEEEDTASIRRLFRALRTSQRTRKVGNGL